MVDTEINKRKMRKRYRNIQITQIINYRLPWAGKVSILHRISGALLFLCLPGLLYLLELSLSSEAAYTRFTELLELPTIKLFILVLVWAYLHHFCAGIRYLLLDIHIGLQRQMAQRSAVTVLAVSLSLSALFAARLFHFL
jgi:succinate dehydrogenase / fumarate reductase cytochrome b subunit